MGPWRLYWQPQQFEATRLNPDDFGLANPFGKVIHNAAYDFSGEIGGSIPPLRDKLFFFGSVDPTNNMTYQIAPPTTGLFELGQLSGNTWVYNYAGKLTFKINDKNTIEGSVFGDPSYSNTFPWVRLNEGVKGIPNTTQFSKLTYGSRDVVRRAHSRPLGFSTSLSRGSTINSLRVGTTTRRLRSSTRLKLADCLARLVSLSRKAAVSSRTLATRATPLTLTRPRYLTLAGASIRSTSATLTSGAFMTAVALTAVPLFLLHSPTQRGIRCVLALLEVSVRGRTRSPIMNGT